MSRLRGARWWHGLVSVVIAAGVGVLTNLATGGFSWALTVFLVVLVVVQVGLSAWQVGRDRQDMRDARDAMLGQLRPPAPIFSADEAAAGQGGGGSGARGVVHWLTAPFSPTPLWGRSAVRDRLVAWCEHRDPRAEVARVIVGSAGVGKSRLALAVAESLLGRGWAAGRLQGDGAGLVERIVAADDPTLVIVDDAERVAAHVLEALLGGAMRHPDLVRVVLLARTAAAVPVLSDTVLPHLRRIETLEPVGEASDRQRWYGEAVRAYARTLQVSPPDLPNRPVGADDDTPLVLHARALLAVLGRLHTRTQPPSELFTELVALEQRGWTADLSRLPAGCDTDTLAEALTVLLLSPAADIEEAATVLRRLPQFAHDTAQESRIAIAGWVHRRYPLGPDHRPGLVPHLVADRLVLDILSRRPQLLRDQDAPAAAPVLARAYATYNDALEQLTILITHHISQLPETLTVILATGVTGHLLDRALADLISTVIADDIRARERLLVLTPPAVFPHLRAACTQLLVTYNRQQVETEPDRHRPELASSLTNLGICLHAVGRYREALEITEEDIAIRRGLADIEPGRYDLELASSLTNLANYLDAVGRYREALETIEEAIAIYRRLADIEPGRYDLELATSLNNLGAYLWAVGQYREALETAEEAVAIHRGLADIGSDRYNPEFATSLNNLGTYLQSAGRHREGLETIEEAVAIRRGLAEIEPDRYFPDLADSLDSLGIALPRAGRYQEALEITEEAVAIRRGLAEIEPDWHNPDLANSLNNLGIRLAEAGRYREALETTEEAVAILRGLAEIEPNRYFPDLADSLTNLGIDLQRVGRYQEALEITEQDIAIRRGLAEIEPDRHNPDLADSLNNLGNCLEKAHDIEGALLARREALAVWKACSAKDPQGYEARYRTEVARLCQQLNLLGRHDEAGALGLHAPESPTRRANNA